jgi:Rha family phage regulatory protein
MGVPVVYKSSNDLDVAVAFTNSRLVAERFGKRHADVMRSISAQIKYNKENQMDDFTERNFALSSYKDSTGKPNAFYEMTEDGFLSIAMSFTGKEAQKIRVILIQEFRKLERELSTRRSTRELGIASRNRLTKAIQETYHGDKIGFKIKAHTDLAYTAVLGMNAKKFRETHGISANENIRPYLSADNIHKLDECEAAIAFMRRQGFEYDAIKKIVLNKAIEQKK